MGNPWGRAGKPEEKEQEVKKETRVVAEVVTEAPVVTPQNQLAPSESTPLVLVSETDAYIHERMKSQPKSLEKISIEVMDDYGERSHILKLPVELEPYCKLYAFRWVNKKKRAIDHAIDVRGWSFVNRVLFKEIPKHLFTANGSIERGDAILTFMPIDRAEKLRMRPAEISRERVNNTPVQDLRHWKDRGESYYKPDLGAAENDAEMPKGIVVTPDNDIKETEQ